MPAIRINPTVASTITVSNSGVFTVPVSLSGSVATVGYPGSRPTRPEITNIYELVAYMDQTNQNLYNMGVFR